MSQVAISLPQRQGFLLDGAWLTEGSPFTIASSYDGSVAGATFRPTAAHLEAAIQAAARSFATTRKLPAYERQRMLREIAASITENRETLARTITLEATKPIKTARQEVERATLTFNVAAEESVRIHGEWLPLDLIPSAAGRWGMVRRFPLGPIAAISPFNFPLNLVAHKWAPAIAAGCPIVHKPASQTPLSSLLLARLVEKAGWPAGALNVLPLAGRDADALVTDDRLKLLTFTGSPAVGWELKRRSGKKRVTLELGGNAGVIIHHDADLEFAAERCVAGGFAYAGQSCISVQRIFIHNKVFDQFTQIFVPKVQKLRVGDPLNEATDVSAMISTQEAARAESWIQEAVTAGARILCGGKRLPAPHDAVLEPTVISGAASGLRVNCQEIFAPVVTLQPYEDFRDAVRQVNQSDFGLQAGLFTRDTGLLFYAYEELEVGGVVAGDVPTFRVDHMPYGGVKDSGMGREGLRYAIEEMTEMKLLVMNPPSA
jgi:acyl-CoA reductase-like NAD-dependent aldehyde dehydrogenase